MPQPLLQSLHNAMVYSNAAPQLCCSTCIMPFVPRQRSCAAALSPHLPVPQELMSVDCDCCALTPSSPPLSPSHPHLTRHPLPTKRKLHNFSNTDAVEEQVPLPPSLPIQCPTNTTSLIIPLLGPLFVAAFLVLLLPLIAFRFQQYHNRNCNHNRNYHIDHDHNRNHNRCHLHHLTPHASFRPSLCRSFSFAAGVADCYSGFNTATPTATATTTTALNPPSGLDCVAAFHFLLLPPTPPQVSTLPQPQPQQQPQLPPSLLSSPLSPPPPHSLLLPQALSMLQRFDCCCCCRPRIQYHHSHSHSTPQPSCISINKETVAVICGAQQIGGTAASDAKHR